MGRAADPDTEPASAKVKAFDPVYPVAKAELPIPVIIEADLPA